MLVVGRFGFRLNRLVIISLIKNIGHNKTFYLIYYINSLQQTIPAATWDLLLIVCVLMYCWGANEVGQTLERL